MSGEPDPTWIPPYVAENRARIHELNSDYIALMARVSELESSLHWLSRLMFGAIVSAVAAYIASRYS
jgi:hypothetical protein